MVWAYRWLWGNANGRQHAVDVEATVLNGALNVGVFAPGGMLDVEGAGKLLQDVREGLEGV
jgi:hypothetical protein